MLGQVPHRPRRAPLRRQRLHYRLQPLRAAARGAAVSHHVDVLRGAVSHLFVGEADRL